MTTLLAGMALFVALNTVAAFYCGYRHAIRRYRLLGHF